MKKSVIWAIAEKDMRSIWSNNKIWLPMIILPIVFCVILPAVFVLTVRYGGVTGSRDLIDFLDNIIGKMPEGALRDRLQSLPSYQHQMIYMLANYMLTPFFLMVPVFTALLIATASFVGEKERRTLESLLFSPISINGLFIGKALASFVPTMAVALASYLACAGIVNVLAAPMFDGLLLTSANWLVMILWVVPIFSLTTILFSVLVSAKVKGFQEAQQLGGVIVLPIVAIIVSQFTGLFLLSITILWIIGAVLLAANVILFKLITKMNKRSVLFENQIH